MAIGATVGVLIGVLVGIQMTRSETTPAAPTQVQGQAQPVESATELPLDGEADPLSHEHLGFSTSFARRLVQEHERLLASGGALVAGQLVHHQGAITLDVTETLWETAEWSNGPGMSIEVSIEAGSRDLDILADNLPASVVALSTGSGTITGLAIADGSGAFSDIASDDLFFLAVIAEDMASSGFTPQPADRCASTASVEPGDRSPQEALEEYFAALGNVSLVQSHQQESELREAAELIALTAPQRVDEVTGLSVHAVAADIERQLKSGLSPEKVTIRYEVPVLISAGSTIDPLNDIAAVFEPDTGDLVAWVGLTPPGWRPEDDSEMEWVWRTYLPPTAPGESFDIVVRSLTDDSWHCPLRESDTILLTLEHDDFAGTHRALIDIDRGEVLRAHVEDF